MASPADTKLTYPFAPRESGWWIDLAVHIEARQHLGHATRQAILSGLHDAREGGQTWALDPCIRLGLFEQAWDLQIASNTEAGGIKVDHAPAKSYALWTLGQAPGPLLRGEVRPQDREIAFGILQQTASASGDELRLLRSYVERRDHSDYVRAINALCGIGRRIPDVTRVVASIAKDASEPARGYAMQGLLVAASSGQRSALHALSAIASEAADPLRGWAMDLLGIYSAVRPFSAAEFLGSVTRELEDPGRIMAIFNLVLGARGGKRESTDMLASIVRARSDPARPLALLLLVRSELVTSDDFVAMLTGDARTLRREQAIWQAAASAAGGDLTAATTLVSIASDSRDPGRGLAIMALGSVIGEGESDAVDALAKIASTPWDPAQMLAITSCLLASLDRQVSLQQVLLPLALDATDPDRAVVIWALSTAMTHRPAQLPSIQALGSIAADPNDPTRAQAVWTLSRLLAIQSQPQESRIAALRAFADIAGRQTDPARSLARYEPELHSQTDVAF